MSTKPLATLVHMFGRRVYIVCDRQCDKAYGIDARPRHLFSKDPDDYEFLADHEVLMAPTNPGTFEGGQGKPPTIPTQHNKWCARQCERSDSFHELVFNHTPTTPLRNFTVRPANRADRFKPDHQYYVKREDFEVVNLIDPQE